MDNWKIDRIKSYLLDIDELVHNINLGTEIKIEKIILILDNMGDLLPYKRDLAAEGVVNEFEDTANKIYIEFVQIKDPHEKLSAGVEVCLKLKDMEQKLYKIKETTTDSGIENKARAIYDLVSKYLEIVYGHSTSICF